MADWDLSAVVRSCNSTTNTTNQNGPDQDPLAFLASLPCEIENEEQFSFPNSVNTTRNFDKFDELKEVYIPFLLSKPKIISSIFNEIPDHQQQQPQLVQQPADSAFVFGESSEKHQQRHPKKGEKSQACRPRKRKNQQKREVVHVTAEKLSSDLWAWRKYGQKPIKGSPYPRNYYRCSSSKGCGARKQVERSNADPNIFVLTYTGEHTHPRPTHRNSLAGSTRNKVQKTGSKNDAAQAAGAAEEEEAPPAERDSDHVDQEFEDFDDALISNLAMNDDLFAELRGLGGAGGAFEDDFPPGSPGSSAATAGGD